MSNYSNQDSKTGHPVLNEFFDVFVQAAGNNGVLAKNNLDLTVADSSNRELSVSSGSLVYDGTEYTYGGTSNLTVSENSSGDDRWDLVVYDVDSTSVSVKEGTTEEDPTPPRVSTNEYIIGVVYIPSNSSTIDSENVLDLNVRSTKASEIYDEGENGTVENVYVNKSGDSMSGNLDMQTNTVLTEAISGTDVQIDGSNSVRLVAEGNVNKYIDIDTSRVKFKNGDIEMEADSGDVELNSLSGLILNSSDTLDFDVANNIENIGDSEFLRFIAEKVTSDPSSNLVEGRLIYRTDSESLKIYNGSSWINIGKIQIEDDGSSVETTNNLNFGSNLSVASDGDGTVTIDSTDTNTDTRTDVSEDGSTVVSETEDINFSNNLDVTDDGDGTVTVDSTDTSTTAGESEKVVQADLQGSVSSGDSVVSGKTFKLQDQETIEITVANLLNSDLTQAPSGLNLTIITTDNAGSFTKQVDILSGDGSTVFDYETGSPLVSYQNTSGSSQSLAVVVDNGEFGAGSGSSENFVASYKGKIL